MTVRTAYDLKPLFRSAEFKIGYFDDTYVYDNLHDPHFGVIESVLPSLVGKISSWLRREKDAKSTNRYATRPQGINA